MTTNPTPSQEGPSAEAMAAALRIRAERPIDPMFWHKHNSDAKIIDEAIAAHTAAAVEKARKEWDAKIGATLTEALATERTDRCAERDTLTRLLAEREKELAEMNEMLRFIEKAGWIVGTFEGKSSMHLSQGIQANGVVGDFIGLIRQAMKSKEPYCESGIYTRMLKAEAQLADLQRSNGERWQPIETAPRDETEILIKTSLGVVSAWFHDEPGEYYQWVCYDDAFTIEGDGGSVTHWMPLPTPPPSAGASGKAKAP